MRKIYFIIFGVALVILILLVDWREKFDAIIGKKSGDEMPLGHLQPATSAETELQTNPEDSSLAAALAEELNETTAASAVPEADGEQNPLLPNPLPASQRPRSPRAGNALARPPARGDLASPDPGLRQGRENNPRFQDVPEQPYMEESRQLLRQMVRNYDRIISPSKPPSPNPDKP